MTVDTASQVSSIVSAYHWVRCSDTFGVFTAAVNEDTHRCCHACDLKVHAPSIWGIGALRADLGPICCDLKCIPSMMAVNAVAQLSCVTSTDDW